MLPDPRIHTVLHGEDDLVTLATRSLAAEIAVHQEKLDDGLRASLRNALLSGDGARLARAIDHAPSADVARHIWRRLAEAFAQDEDAAIVPRLFAMPVVLVAGAGVPFRLDGVLGDTRRLREILQQHGALARNMNFTLGDALVNGAAIDLDRLPELCAWQLLPAAGTLPQRVLKPAAIAGGPPHEAVHLRFLVGAAVAGARVDLFGRADVGKWGVPFSQQLVRQLAQPDVTLLALPRAPMSPVIALHAGRAAQREVGLQIYASNAIRDIRGKVGEPTAVVSAHRAPDAPCGAEVRISLSSPFAGDATSMAEGFRCPLYAIDRVADVERTVLGLLEDCRVREINVLQQVFPDRDPDSGARLFFRSETLARAGDLVVQ